MIRYIADIETNGLLPDVSTIHCLVLRDLDTDEVQTFTSENIKEGLKILYDAEEVVGHNWIGYDSKVIAKLHPWFEGGTGPKVTDTMILSQLIKPHIIEFDASVPAIRDVLPKRLWGSHSLKAWGLRLNCHKGDYEGGWEAFSQEMLDYCVQDTAVTATIYKYLMQEKVDDRCIELEHKMAEVCYYIGNNGWTFDMPKAEKLYATLSKERHELNEQLYDLFPPWIVEEPFVPARDNKTLGYKKGEVFIKKREVVFNPNSRPHIEHCLRQKYGWEPEVLTPSGKAQIDETTLGKLEYPEAQKLARFFLLQKRIGQLAEGPQAWMKVVNKDGRIRHSIISQGTISGRAAHRGPNLGQVPATRLPFGKECRELFTVPKGWKLLGSDLSGLELRCFAHFMDDPEYCSTVLDGDIHTYNQKAAGLPTRDLAKTFIYATLYGGGDMLIGKLAGGGPKEGRALKQAFENSVPAFARLKRNLQTASQRGYLYGLDGRHLYLRSEHKALSQLLQSAGAVLCKQWVLLIDQAIQEHYPDGDCYIVGWIHDEVQIACRTEEIAEHVGRDITTRMARESGEAFKFKIPITSEYQIGNTWADTH